MAAQIRAGRAITCKPFKKHHAEQLKLVSSFDWIDFEKLKDVESMITAVLSDEKNGEFIDESRVSAIASAVGGRVQILREIALTHTPSLAEITTEDDVEGNIEEDYTPKMGMQI